MNPTQPLNPQMKPQQPMMMQRPSSSKAPWVILGLVVLIVLGVLGYMFRGQLTGDSSKAQVLSGYQAVFLTNGQVYFGKISNPSGDYVNLKDIYYLQVNEAQNLQQGQAPAANAQQPQLSLVKLGNELHGPVDSMEINRSQILFFEDLKSDGRVAQAIAEYKKNGAAPANQAPATQAPANQAPATPAR